MSPFYRPFLEELPDRILPSAGPHISLPSSLPDPGYDPQSQIALAQTNAASEFIGQAMQSGEADSCIAMHTTVVHGSAMEILTPQERCCSAELEVHFEHGELVIHLPTTFEGRMVRIEGRDGAVVVGHDGHAHIPFTEPAGTVTLTITNHEGEPVPFLRITHDGHGAITHKECLTDLHKLMMEEEHEVHLPHESHIEIHPPHILHEEHPHPVHVPHIPHMEHVEKHESHVPHPLHEEEEHQEPALLEEHEPLEESPLHSKERSMDQREREDRALFEEAFDWGSWGEEEPTIHPPVPAQGEQSTEEKEDPRAPGPSELWPIFGGATVAAAALAGAYALERRARRK